MNLICYLYNRGFWIAFFISCSVSPMLAACSCPEKPTPSNMAKVRMLTDNKIISETFKIPKSIFRGVLWPSKGNENFQIWTIDGRKEFFFNIPAPRNFTNNTEVTKQWDIKTVKSEHKRKLYKITSKDKSKALELELPIKRRDYNFAVLKNESDDYLILFMDISEDINDKGLFGYILIYSTRIKNQMMGFRQL